MGLTVCVSANTLTFPTAGGHLWVYLNWALGLRALECRVIWLEAVVPTVPAPRIQQWIALLKSRLEPYGLERSVVVCSWTDQPLPAGAVEGCLALDAATEADLLLNQQYGLRCDIVKRFRRSALLDLDPGLLQLWMHKGLIDVAQHDVYFTTGETVGRAEALFPSGNVEWQYTPPCVMTDWWRPQATDRSDSRFTTVSSWDGGEWIEDQSGVYTNDKRSGFLPFIDLPRRVEQPLELALSLTPAQEAGEGEELRQRGWNVVDACEVAGAPDAYERYIRCSLGEFSCAKPSCLRLQNAWISDRTLCYLASGKPAVVQHTGPSRFLPEDTGLFRFNTEEQAASQIERVAADYPRQCHLARALAEEYFDARKVVASVLERAVT